MSRTASLFLLIILVFVISVIPVLNWPFTWIATYFHEISHGIVALFTGGSVQRMRMYLPGGGICEVQGGWRFLVAFSGYGGAVLWGVLIYLEAEAMRPHTARNFARGLACMVGITALLWARDTVSILILTSIIAFFLTVSTFRNGVIVRFITQLTGLYVLLKSVMSPLALIDGRHYGDGATLADITMIPEIIWVCIWIASGIGGLLFVWRQRGNLRKSSPHQTER